MPEIPLPAAVSVLLDRLRDSGFSAYAVGGCIRDSLLGRPVHDWDITTAARPENTKAVFSDLRTLDTGLRHGTVTVLYGNVPYEITTYRIDGAYADGRHPDAVAFTDLLAEDLKRRDFTVNAMAYAPSDGLVDLFGGREDLQRRLMRAVGDPAERFTEDALRILRAFCRRARFFRGGRDLLCRLCSAGSPFRGFRGAHLPGNEQTALRRFSLADPPEGSACHRRRMAACIGQCPPRGGLHFFAPAASAAPSRGAV